MMTKFPAFALILIPALLASPVLATEPASTTLPAASPAPEAASTPDATPAVPAPEAVQPAIPAPAPEASLVDMVKALSKFLTEEETQMVYDYLWDSSIAALKGDEEEITLPPELVFKLAILQRRIVKEGGFYLDGLAKKMEKDLARYWQEKLMTPAPPVPYSLPSERAAPK